MSVRVLKIDGRIEDFLKEKITVALYKAGLDLEVARKISEEIEKELLSKREVDTKKIREKVLEKLENYPEVKRNFLLYENLIKGKITFEEGELKLIRKGKVYLGRDVKDIGKRGLSDLEEVKGIIREMEEDLSVGISKRVIQSRSYILFLAVLKSRSLKKEDKIKAIELINEFREKHGWKPLTPKYSIE